MENNDKGIYCINVSNLFIGTCHIHHNNGPALDGYNLLNVEVKNCLVHNNGQDLKDNGICTGGFEFGMANEIHSNLTVSDCVIHDNIGMGINIMKGDKVSVNQNDIYRNSWRGVRFISVSNIIIHHNQIFENGQVGIIGEGYIVSNIEIVNNTISKNGQGDEFYHGGIYLQGCSPGVIIKNNNISLNNGTGVYPNGTPDVIIIGNDIIGNLWDGIYLPKFYDFFTIKNNNIKGNLNGISITCNNTNVSGNIISKNEIGIGLYYGSNNVIHGNEISNNNEGIHISTGATNNEVSCNNLMNNDVQANFYYRFTDSLPLRRNNNFYNNYWNRLRLFPKPIFGKLRIRLTIFGNDISETIPWLNFDWHPAQEPYDIGG